MPDLIAELAGKIIETLKLKNVNPESMDPDAPLFGEGLGLDSIDALELVVMLEREYGIRIQDMEVGKKAFASLRAMSEFITQNRPQCKTS